LGYNINSICYIMWSSNITLTPWVGVTPTLPQGSGDKYASFITLSLKCDSTKAMLT